MAKANALLSAPPRSGAGTGDARKLRQAGSFPAVIYGHGTDPVHVALPGHQVALLIRRANVVLELDVNGKQQLTLVKDVQKDPVRQIIEHIDHAVRLVGPTHVGLGSDFDGASMPQGMEDCTQLPKITAALLAKGYSEQDVKNILGENLLRLMEQVEAVAKPGR